jgi:glycosyltransferase involved in cell wall biosynthesis
MMEKSIKICHLTSAHPRFDIRIFHKECVYLARHFETHLVVADNLGNELKNNINIHDVGKETSRLKRFARTPKKVLKKALEIDADIYHFHDPDLLLIAKNLHRRGKKVIYDAHEDVEKQLLSKPYLSPWKARIASRLFARFEKKVLRYIAAVVTATPAIRDKFEALHKEVIDINNFPLMHELFSEEVDWNLKKPQIAYVGGISRIRGILEVISALEHVNRDDQFLQLVGPFSENETAKIARSLNGFSKVIELGTLNRAEVKEVLANSMAGIVTFLPVPNHIEAQPNKMFEYMSAGIPVIGSRFPLWQEILEKNDCGICVDPTKPQEIASAIEFIFSNPERAKEMGLNGLKAIRSKYNWETEQEKLVALYQKLIVS